LGSLFPQGGRWRALTSCPTCWECGVSVGACGIIDFALSGAPVVRIVSFQGEHRLGCSSLCSPLALFSFAGELSFWQPVPPIHLPTPCESQASECHHCLLHDYIFSGNGAPCSKAHILAALPGHVLTQYQYVLDLNRKKCWL
jgi:hypothetical protein